MISVKLFGREGRGQEDVGNNVHNNIMLNRFRHAGRE